MDNSSVEKGIAQIKNIAEDVYRTLGSGFSEDVYDRAMQVGLRLAKIPYEGTAGRNSAGCCEPSSTLSGEIDAGG